MSGLTYLITGANRGIGKALLEVFVARPQTTVIAAVRDVASSQKTLSSVAVGEGSKVIVVKIDSTSESDPADAVAELKSKYNISKVDVLISNAGVMNTKAILPVIETPLHFVREHFEVNTIGPIALIQAFIPLLKASSSPKFLVITSTIGSMGLMKEYPVPFFAYGLSKAAANYFVVKMHYENEWLTTIAYNPGWVQTDMGNGAALGVGLTDAPVTLEESIKGLVEQFDSATREKSGSFILQTGENAPW
ncbi:hypothetical protein G7Y89_g15434 [Cudoniella acicularis]|uniref:Uncharacterized protein n=1 Tax=Cudoniella acicularis TaxID=354080 RepID=A0A8H4QP35_9HELO|nr:hypothetical protein G7Y89_g15434 [Cudoniella acicularis]